MGGRRRGGWHSRPNVQEPSLEVRKNLEPPPPLPLPKMVHGGF